MARQGHRVWIARLSWIAAVLLMGIGITYVAMGWLFDANPMGARSSETNRPVVERHPVSGHIPGGASHPLDPVLSLARNALALHRKRDHNYAATLIRKQRSGKKLDPTARMELKLRSRMETSDSESPTGRPIDVYLKFVEPKSQAGREVIWKQGVDNDLMTVHEAGLLNIARVQLAPTSRLAMMGNRYPITDIGIERLLLKLIDRGLQDRALGDCIVQMEDEVEVAGRKCKRIEVIHPEKNAKIGDRLLEFEYFKATIDMDLEHEIPIHYASYLWPEAQGGDPLLDEEFTYENLELNCGLDDVDFDPDNPDYNYP